MVTGELKTKVDAIWDAFWSGGIANPLEVMEQITYLLFISRWSGAIPKWRRRDVESAARPPRGLRRAPRARKLGPTPPG